MRVKWLKYKGLNCLGKDQKGKEKQGMWLNMHVVMAAPFLRLPVKTRRQSISLLGLLYFPFPIRNMCCLNFTMFVDRQWNQRATSRPIRRLHILHDLCLRVGGINWAIPSLGRQCFLHLEKGKGPAPFIEKSGLRQQYCYVFSKLISFSSWLHSQTTFLSLL